MSTTDEKIAIALTDQATDLLAPMLKHFKTFRWTKEQERPICLICKSADFSGHLVEIFVLNEDETLEPMRLWIPHAYVALAFDFSESRAIGFVWR